MTFKAWLESQNHRIGVVARMANVPRNTLWRFLVGECALSPENIAKLVAVTDGKCSFTDLLREGERRRRAKHGPRKKRTGRPHVSAEAAS